MINKFSHPVLKYLPVNNLFGCRLIAVRCPLDAARWMLPAAHAASACAKFLDFVYPLFYYDKSDIKTLFFELRRIILSSFLEHFNGSAH